MAAQTETKTRTRKSYAPLAEGDFAPVQASPDMVTLLAPTRERDSKPDPMQDAINAAVSAALDAWKLRAEGERSFVKLLAAGLVVVSPTPPNKVETVKFKIRKAGTKYNATIRFGDSGKLDDKGNELVAFAAMTKLPAKPRAKRGSKQAK